MPSLEESLSLAYGSAPTPYHPVSIFVDSPWFIQTLGTDPLIQRMFITSTDIPSAITETETYLTGTLGLVKISTWYTNLDRTQINSVWLSTS